MAVRSVLANVDSATVVLTGSTPLVMDSIEHSDPEDPLSKAIRSITAKGASMTEEDQHRKDRLAYMSSLYLNDDGRLVIPWNNVSRALTTGAYYVGGTALSGKVDKGASCVGSGESLLSYTGPEPPKLFDDPAFCLRKMVNKNPSGKKAMIATTRPKFDDWSVSFPVVVLNDVCGFDDFIRALTATGATVGIGNARKLGYGRFTVRAEKTAGLAP